ncbi:DNA-processing protein DprA [Deinococcota bacterium DY0809b]
MSWMDLALTPGVGPARFLKVFEAGEEGLERVDELLGAELARAYRRVREAGAAGRVQERAAALGVRPVGLWAADYPPTLRHLADPPPLVYLKGGWSGNRPAVAVVGSRKAQPWALDFARGLARSLAEAGVGVVSGLARGVDTAAHEGALAGGGSTLAVLGSGVDVVYPPENAGLAARVTLMSELPLGSGPSAGSFPRRNRLIAALADAVVIVQAPEKSGALITAALAAELGREVLAVPGRPSDWASRGSNRLLADGAGVVQAATDVLDALGIGGTAPPADRPEPEGAAEALWEALRRRGEALPDDLALDLNLGAAEVLGLLTQLELSGHVRALPGGRYEAVG